MTLRSYRVKSVEDAWKKANEIFPTDYEKDEESSQRAGYPTFRSTADGHYYDYICDLNDRLEVNLSTGETVNIWIDLDPEISSERQENVKQIAIRIQRLGFWFAEEMLKWEETGEKRREEFEREKEENPEKVIVMLDVSENNADCMKQCLRSCVKSYQYLGKYKDDVEEWQLAGITSMLDKANSDGIIPYDLPFAIEGVLLILDQESREEAEQ